tara:strand:+ start:19 stop:381 length:363 start_codon:yes stop_codon:yes gene_type:complete
MKTSFVRCSCYTEGLLAEYDEDDELYYISFLGQGPENFILSWRNRIRHIWKVFVSGRPYSDQVILSKEEARKLIIFFCDNTPHLPTTVDTFTDKELNMVLAKDLGIEFCYKKDKNEIKDI